MKQAIIREVLEKDNLALANVIREVLIDLGVPKVGTAYEDPELDHMYQCYLQEKSSYFVLDNQGELLGGSGVAPLKGGDPSVCELQKMYFLSKARGQGLGDKIIDYCLSFAKEQGFKICYIETLPYMEAAQKLYVKKGFQYIKKPMGSTGHTSCNIWLTKDL
jgi:putative acetyltransferase